MARKKLKWSDMRPSEKRDHVIYLIGQILKWLFVGSMCIFTLYPVVYTLLGSFKTNAELTLGGNFLPENWQFNNYVYAFQKLDFGKYFLNSVVRSEEHTSELQSLSAISYAVSLIGRAHV